MTNQQFNTHGDWKFTANEIKPNTGNNLQLYSNNDNDELALTLSGGDAIVENSLQGFKYLASHYPSTTPEQILDVTVSRKEQSNRYHELGTTLSSYFIDGVEAPFLTLTPGITYQFNQNHTSNSGHLLQLSTLPTKNGLNWPNRPNINVKVYGPKILHTFPIFLIIAFVSPFP